MEDYWFLTLLFGCFFFPPVQFSLERVAGEAAAASGPSRFRGPSPEAEGAHYSEQGKDMIQRTP